MEYSETLNYEIEYLGQTVKVTAKVLGYDEFYEWLAKWKPNPDKPQEGRSDDQVLEKVISVDVQGAPKDLKKADIRLVKAVVTGYLYAAGILDKTDPAKKSSENESKGA